MTSLQGCGVVLTGRLIQAWQPHLLGIPTSRRKALGPVETSSSLQAQNVEVTPPVTAYSASLVKWQEYQPMEFPCG